VATDRQSLDLSNLESTAALVRQSRPHVIINAAAYTAVDRAETELDLARKVNAAAPGVLAEEARKLGALLVHYSTDYIFDGTKRAPYREDDLPAPINAYGRTKLEGEKRIKESGARYLLLRTSWVYAPRGRNFFLAIAAKARAGGPLRVVADQTGVPTSAAFLAGVTRRLVEAGEEGTVNAVPSGTTTWHGFAVAIVQRLALNLPVEPIGTADYPTPAKRPAYSVLDNAKLVATLGVQPGWESLLDSCVREWNRS
jgi:dTDP-4-dehydrorhamnose reductase